MVVKGALAGKISCSETEPTKWRFRRNANYMSRRETFFTSRLPVEADLAPPFQNQNAKRAIRPGGPQKDQNLKNKLFFSFSIFSFRKVLKSSRILLNQYLYILKNCYYNSVIDLA